ncbi:hypothetical protein K502DRAFT_347784 [Neoconidiobolus thromboides FSU 785]|nr:hypothetical protein K502DRAFT_347784 [Neoconidiobolus thromboides FSU 785]
MPKLRKVLLLCYECKKGASIFNKYLSQLKVLNFSAEHIPIFTLVENLNLNILRSLIVSSINLLYLDESNMVKTRFNNLKVLNLESDIFIVIPNKLNLRTDFNSILTSKVQRRFYDELGVRYSSGLNQIKSIKLA